MKTPLHLSGSLLGILLGIGCVAGALPAQAADTSLFMPPPPTTETTLAITTLATKISSAQQLAQAVQTVNQQKNVQNLTTQAPFTETVGSQLTMQGAPA